MSDRKKQAGSCAEVKTEACGRTVVKTENFKYFQHRECEYFPCHEGADPDNFNCLFCYCPLYFLGDKCGGNFTFTKKDIKNCTGCIRPHLKESYGIITETLKAACRDMAAGRGKE